jgi:hypothetical protein
MTRLVSVAAFDYEHQTKQAVSYFAYKSFKTQLKPESVTLLA